MRLPWLALSCLLVVGTATAESRPSRVEERRPSPCEHYIPTGVKLPRAETSTRGILIMAIPNGTWRDRPIAKTYPDEPVTILQECGLQLRIRTVRGEEGWVPIGMFPNEVTIYERARRKPPETEAECAQRFLDARLIEDCQRPIVAKRRIDAEAKNSSYVAAGELSAFLSGKTLVLRPRSKDVIDDPAYPTVSYFAPDGEVFLKAGKEDDMLWRGRWVLEGDSVCLPHPHDRVAVELAEPRTPHVAARRAATRSAI